MNTPTNCAWCQAERGEVPQAGESHGICERHAREMRAAAESIQRRMWWSNPAKRRESLEFAAGVLAGALVLALGLLAMFAL